MKIRCLHHGKGMANTLRIIANRDQAIPLKALGEQQTRDVAERFSGEPVALAPHSLIPRALQTARIVAARPNAPLEACDVLREPDCRVLERRSDVESWDRRRALPRTWLIDLRWDQKIEGGETSRICAIASFYSWSNSASSTRGAATAWCSWGAPHPTPAFFPSSWTTSTTASLGITQ
jgi:broad specificity phosphatase PhoE